MLHITVTATQRAELQAVRDHDRRPYLRERAAAVLKVADGHSATQVAQTGLLRPHPPVVVRGWARRYLAQGIASLVRRPQPGAGRPPGAKDTAPRKRRAPRVPSQDRPDP